MLLGLKDEKAFDTLEKYKYVQIYLAKLKFLVFSSLKRRKR